MRTQIPFDPRTLTPQDVLNFWFDKNKSNDENTRFWFGGGQAADALIRTQFGACVEHAATGGFSDWQQSAEESLALILLLDQFPLNIFRNEKRSFETIRKALPIAVNAMERGFDKGKTVFEKLFFYLPFEHAEDLSMQKRSLELFKNLVENAAPEEKKSAQFFEKYAFDHYVVIERFGRFPTWNKVLDRRNTPEEDEYIAAGGSPF